MAHLQVFVMLTQSFFLARFLRIKSRSIAGSVALFLCFHVVISDVATAEAPRKSVETDSAENAKKLTIITLGDSITKGVRREVTAEQTFTSLLQNLLKEEGVTAQVINSGIGSERADQALKRLEKSAIDKKPDIVTIMYGTNDSYVDRGKTESRLSLQQYRSNLQELVTRQRKVNIVPVLMTEPRLGNTARKNGLGEHPNLRLEQFVSVCRNVAEQMHVPLVDNYKYWTDHAKNNKSDIGVWTTDQCHPNPHGHKIITKTILPVLLQTIRKDKPAKKP
jgi:lysophospholipase L1-like esterase